jgi:hypothetical protein
LQGENGLEQYLREIREEWSAYEVELGNFQNKTKVIKGWDELFAKVRARARVCLCMFIYIYIYMCVCVVCVCAFQARTESLFRCRFASASR